MNFKNTIIIMTSNLGSEYILENKNEELVMNELKQTFRPEFINRIDEIVIFNSLSKTVVYDIINKIIKEIEERLQDKKIKLLITDKAKEYIINNAYNEQYGARPIKRFITKNIENKLAKIILEDKIKYNSIITIDVENDNIILK